MAIEQKKLDDLVEIKILDPSNMWERMIAVPEQIISAGKQVSEIALPEIYRNAKAVVFAGMGGSAVAGDFLQSVLLSKWCERGGRQVAAPIFLVSRSRSLPSWVDETTLVFISSYSGNTEETLACFDDAVERAAMIIAFTSGGKLHEKATGAGVPIFDVGGFIHQGLPPRDTVEPRTTVMASFVGSLGVLCRLGLVDGELDTVWLAAFAREVMSFYIPSSPTNAAEEPTIEGSLWPSHNLAKQLATRLAGKIVVVYGGDELDSVARRWKTQINENADSWAFAEALPDANHNSVNGYRLEDMESKVEVVLLSNGDPRFPKLDKVQELFRSKGVPVQSVSIHSQMRRVEDRHRFASSPTNLQQQVTNHANRVAEQGHRALVREKEREYRGWKDKYNQHLEITRILIGTCLGDWVSYYMALLTGVDPSPVPHITALKDVP